jgi:hypothetical protein
MESLDHRSHWFASENQGADIAMADLNGDGRPEVIVFQIDSPEGANQGYCRVGWSLDAAGQVTGGWSPWIAVPDWFAWENQGAGIAIADLDGNGRPEMVVFQVDSPAGLNAGYYRVGWNLDADGQVSGGWSEWMRPTGSPGRTRERGSRSPISTATVAPN